MFARIFVMFLIVSLALPVTAITPPAESGQSSWDAATVAAKGKKHKHHKHKRHRKKQQRQEQQPDPTPLTVRQTVTQTFTSAQLITIPNGAPAADKGKANPYPSTIDVTGFTNGTITDVNLVLNDLTHMHQDDIDVLLGTGDGRRALVMSDAGDSSQAVDIDITLDDEAATAMTNTELSSGTYRPTNLTGFTVDTFDAPAPAPDGNVALSTFDGADPNGTWQLWIMDNNGGDYGDLGGWTLQITAEVDVPVAQGQHVKVHHQTLRQRQRLSDSATH
jgi:hypothetical protein